MKPLILILLAAVVAQAQTVADAARRERARQAQVKTTKVFTTEDLKSKEVAEAGPVENLTPATTPAAPAASAPAAPVVDPAQQWTEETTKLRAHVRDLMAQETAMQQQINTSSSQINAPITSQSAKNQAAQTLAESQPKLAAIREELAKAQSELREKDLAGPPQKK